MSEPRPSLFPEYARNDVVDPTTGVNNVVEPSEAKKDLGHGPAGEFPNRQYFNWLHRLTYLWLKYLDDVINGTPETFNVKVTTSDYTAEKTYDLIYKKRGDKVTITLPANVLTGTSNSNTLRIYPNEAATWPSELLPTGNSHYVPCIVTDDGSKERAGALIIGSSDSNPWQFMTPDADGILDIDNFTASNNKGWVKQTIEYQTTDLVS